MKVHILSISDYDPNRILDFIQQTGEEIGLPGKLATAKKVLVKPNILGPYPPERGVTTHPVVVTAWAKYLTGLGKEVLIGDSPGGTLPRESIYQTTGMTGPASLPGVSLVNIDTAGAVRIPLGDYELVVSKAVFDADVVVNVAKMKTHGSMVYTGAVKNLYGTIPGLRKSEYHRQFPKPIDFAVVLADLYQALSPRIAVHMVDGILGMEGAGPSGGDPRKFNLLAMSEDGLAMDVILSRMMGLTLDQIHYLRALCHREGIIPSRIEVDPRWRDYRLPNVKKLGIVLKSMLLSQAPPIVEKVFRKMFDFYPAFMLNCRKCGVCVRSCPVQCLSFPEGSPVPVLDKDRCIKCLCCHELCPHQAVYIQKRFLAGLLIR